MRAYRRIIHVDMDAFYASVETREHPELGNVAMAVGYDTARSVITTANYVARRYGVHSGQPVVTAKRMCPGLVIVPCHFELYKRVSREIHEVFREYTEQIEPISLDEAFLDVTELCGEGVLAMEIAKEIKEKIKARTGLTASAGVSYCKFLAKIASDLRKPDGLAVIHPERAEEFISGLRVKDFWGVGPKTAERMARMGIHTGGDLRLRSLEELVEAFGKAGRIYYDFARGRDERAVEAQRERKSVGCEETYMDDLYVMDDICRQLELLSRELEGRLQRKGFEGNTLTLKAKFADFRVRTRSVTKGSGHWERWEEMLAEGIRLAGLIGIDRENRVRLLGLTVTSHGGTGEARYEGESRQLTLFESPYNLGEG